METGTTILRKNTANKPANKTPQKAAPKADSPCSNAVKKEYLKSRNACKVTFKLPKAACPDAVSVAIAGEFNGWNTEAYLMKRQKNGDYTLTLELETGREYQYRYFIDQSRWENDYNADRYVKSPFGDCDNSVVSI